MDGFPTLDYISIQTKETPLSPGNITSKSAINSGGILHCPHWGIQIIPIAKLRPDDKSASVNYNTTIQDLQELSKTDTKDDIEGNG